MLPTSPVRAGVRGGVNSKARDDGASACHTRDDDRALWLLGLRGAGVRRRCVDGFTTADHAGARRSGRDSTDPASVDSTQQDPGYAVLPADACGARSELAYLCSTCISVPVPRCLGNVPQPVKVPAACAKPACEAPLSLLDRSKEVLEGVVCDSVAGLAVRGQCADGKDFVAILGTMSGAITYFKNGIVAGAAAYSRDSAHGSRQPGRR
jgi:hypothetical protein